MKSTATKLALIFALISFVQAEDRVATLGDLSSDPNGVFIESVLENHTTRPIYTSSPRRIFLQHKVDGEWVDTPHLTLAGHTGTEQQIKIESGAARKVGVDKRLYQSLVFAQYRLKVVLIDPDTGQPVSSLVSQPTTFKLAGDQNRTEHDSVRK